MGNRIIWKLTVSFVLLILFSVIILNFFVSIKLRDYFESFIAERLDSNAVLVSGIIKGHMRTGDREAVQSHVKRLAMAVDARITVLDTRGRVLGDSEEDPARMDGHSRRPEVVQAMQEGRGQSTRESITMGYKMKYVALAVSDSHGTAGVIRMSLPMSIVESRVKVIYRVVLLGGLVAVVFVIITGALVSRGIIGPLMEMTEVSKAMAKGDFSRRLKLRGSDELVLLADSLNRMSGELEKQIERLKQADKLKTDLVANVSHELKTPLTSIMGFIETLEDGALEDGDNARRFLAIIKKHAELLGNTVDDLLALAELEAASASTPGAGRALVHEEFDMKKLVQDVIAGFGYAVKGKGQQMESEFTGLGFTAMGDRLRIEQALVNMIDNAVKYTPQGGHIKVIVRGDGRNVHVTVSDTGVGIPADKIERVFERFYRVDKARSRSVGGTGLGLAIVKHTVLLHGGDVSIDSEPGVGTSISFGISRGI